MGQMQWRGWSTCSDIMAIWNWLDTEQSMMKFTTETIKVCIHVYTCVIVYVYIVFVCVCLCVCVCVCVCNTGHVCMWD